MFQFTYRKQLSQQSNEELLSNFRSENWSKLDENQRIAIAQEVENRNALSQNREPCKVQAMNNTSCYGSYSSQSNTIKVDVNDYVENQHGQKISSNSSYQVLDTIYHEGEHAHQDNCVKNSIEPPQGLPKETRDMCELENYRVTKENINSGNVRNANGDRLNAGEFYNYDKTVKYENCTCEVDSNTAATKKVLENKELYRGDPEYDKYLADRQDAMEKYSATNMDEVRAEQSAAVNESFDRGDISQSKYEEIMTKEIYNGKSQPAFDEAKTVNEEVRKERQENYEYANSQKASQEMNENKESEEQEHSERNDDSTMLSEDMTEDEEYEEGIKRR